MKKITFGIEFDRDGQPIQDKDSRIKDVLTIAAKTFGGCTLHRHQGSWKMNDGDARGKVIIEESVTVDIHTDLGDDLIHNFALACKVLFDQESVIISEQPVKATFV